MNISTALELLSAVAKNPIATEEQIVSIIADSDYDDKVCAEGMPLLTSQKNISTIQDKIFRSMERTNWRADYCMSRIFLLSQSEILTVMEKVKYDPAICAKGMPKLTKEQLMRVMERSGWNNAICEVGVALLNESS